MKKITFTVPCYNSQEYMYKCIDSLLLGGDEVEIIIVDDGSTDNTGKIADEYQVNYPNIIKVIHQKNGGHGAGVNAGLRNATGKYFKVVDSDDWVGADAYKKMLAYMGDWDWTETNVDMLVCNYIYDHFYENKQHVINYKNIFPKEEVCSWNDIGHFMPSQYLVMHALIFKTEILRESKVELPSHTFYVDNIFAYQPLPFVKDIFYLPVDLYHYFLGREDQSVNESVMMKRIDQQIRVTKIVSNCVDIEEVEKKYPKLAEYMTRNISIMLAISSIHLLLIHTQDAWEKRADVWNYVKDKNKRLYRKLRFRTLSGLTYLPGKAGGAITVTGYRVARKIYKFQ